MHNATQSNTTITTHCTTSTELLLSGTDDSSVTRRTSFKLQKCCHYFVSNPCSIIMYCEETRTDAYVTKGEVQNMWRHRTHSLKTAHATFAVYFFTCTLHNAQWSLWEMSQRLMQRNLTNSEKLTAVCEGRLVLAQLDHTLVLHIHCPFRLSTQFIVSKMWHYAHPNSKKWIKITSPYDVALKQ